MNPQFKEIITKTLEMDKTVTQDQINRAISILDGVEILNNAQAPTAAQKLAGKGRLLKCREAAEMLGVTTQSLRNWRKKTGLKPVVPPGNTKPAGYWEGDILDFIEEMHPSVSKPA